MSGRRKEIPSASIYLVTIVTQEKKSASDEEENLDGRMVVIIGGNKSLNAANASFRNLGILFFLERKIFAKKLVLEFYSILWYTFQYLGSLSQSLSFILPYLLPLSLSSPHKVTT